MFDILLFTNTIFIHLLCFLSVIDKFMVVYFLF